MTDRENTVKGQGENLLFRRLEKEDAPAAAALEKSCLTEAWSLSAWEAGLTDLNAFYAGAFLDGKLVGCCGIWQSFEDADVCNVAVDPSLRRRRIGERLLLFLMEEGRKRGVEQFTLEVRSSNTAAVSLYTKLGFVQEGVRRGFYENPREDALILDRKRMEQLPVPIRGKIRYNEAEKTVLQGGRHA